MDTWLERLPKEEQVTLELRALLERRGYRRYQMSSFETYDMYSENKSFLRGGGVITFTDAYGRLMALKPDVTMSIVKNTKETEAESKLYYMENVFRTAQHGSDIREISQMGVEYIGGEGAYAETEVALLAEDSLAAIHEKWILNLSHMGFVQGMLRALALPEAARAQAMEALRGKNAHALRAVAQEAGCTEEQAASLAALAALSGPPKEALRAAGGMACSDEMHAAVTALTELCSALAAVDAAENLRVDFSVAGDVDYYNGLILQGYVEGVPHAVLTGGRYDNLMRRFGKPQAALGFALGLGELGRAFARQTACDVDVLLLYTVRQPAALVARAVKRLEQDGRSVRAARAVPTSLRAGQTLRLLDSGETEAVLC